MHHEERTKVLHKLLYSIIHEVWGITKMFLLYHHQYGVGFSQEALSQPCVFGIDNAHLVDSDSWEFILDLALDPNAILVMTTRPLRKQERKSLAMLEILNHPHTKVVRLQGLCPDDMVTLACNFINADSLPEPLQHIIRERSHGIPQWCEELVETMVELQYLKVSNDPPSQGLLLISLTDS